MELLDRRDLELLREKYGEGEELKKAIGRVQSGEPLAYVIGEWYFYGLTFSLNESCLIPRPDTEHAVEAAIKMLPKGGCFIDLCTGSGCIAVSVLKHRPDVTAYALEIAPAALEKAEFNAKANGVSERIRFIGADVFALDPIEAGLPQFDAVVSNPPYIRSDVVPTLEVSKSEPLAALDGGADGLDFYRHILKAYAPTLKDGGTFIFEIGYDQGDDIKALAEERNMSCEVSRDYGGNDRVAVIRRL